jgi:hypothetical protein
MHENPQLENLNVSELNVLLGHLQLGIEHLQKYLTHEQLSQLLDYGWIDPHQFQKIQSDRIEKHGNITLMANTVFTCVIGGWLASISFIGVSPAINSFALLFILGAAVISSGYFGYISFKKVRLEAKEAISTQKLANLKLKLLRLIKQKNQHIIDSLIDRLNGALSNFPHGKSFNAKINSLNSFESEQEFIQWFNELSNNIDAESRSLTEKPIYRFFIKRIKNIKLKLKRAIDTNLGLVEHAEKKEQQNNHPKKSVWFSLAEKKHQSFITALTDPAFVPKLAIKKKSWLKNNMYSILNGLIPTALGGFCSLFTYFSGLPNVARELGVHSLDRFFESAATKFVTLFIISTLTAYFAYISIYGNRKSFQRKQELEKTQKLIANEEAEILALTSKLNLLRKVEEYLKSIFLIFTFIRHISKTQ